MTDLPPAAAGAFPLDQVTSLVGQAAGLVERYLRDRETAASATEYLALEDLTDAIVYLLDRLDRFDPAGAEHRAHACSAGCSVVVEHFG